MIEINLLPGKKRAAPAGAGFKLGLKLPDFRAILANITNPWLLAASAAWVLVLGGGLALFVTSRARLAVLNSRLEQVRVEKRRFDAVIAQKRQSEKIRDSLVAEINVIHQIDADRYIWPHILDQVTKALPPYTWLTGISAQAGQPGVGRQRLGHLVEDVRPDVAVGVDLVNDVDLGDQGVADLLRLALLGDHRVEPPLLDPHLLQPGVQHGEPRAARDEQGEPAPEHEHPGSARREQPRVRDVGEDRPEIGELEAELEARPRRRRPLLAGE